MEQSKLAEEEVYEVLTGSHILNFETLNDAKVCASYIKGVVRDFHTHEILADYYNTPE